MKFLDFTHLPQRKKTDKPSLCEFIGLFDGLS